MWSDHVRGYISNIGGYSTPHKKLRENTVDKCMYMYLTLLLESLYENIICGHCVFKEMCMDPHILHALAQDGSMCCIMRCA